MKHYKIGGSTAARTINCPAWIGATENIPKQPASTYADAGTLCHNAMEEHYVNGTAFSELVEKEFSYNKHTLTEDIVEALLVPAKKAVELVKDTFGIDEFICEPFVELIPELVGGSIDMLGRGTDTLLILDYKFGASRVHVADNQQLQFYAACVRQDPSTAHWFDGITEIAYVIVQPKANKEPDVWTSSVHELDVFEIALHMAILETSSDKPTFKQGYHCHYCPITATCAEKNKQKLKDAKNLMSKLVDSPSLFN